MAEDQSELVSSNKPILESRRRLLRNIGIGVLGATVISRIPFVRSLASNAWTSIEDIFSEPEDTSWRVDHGYSKGERKALEKMILRQYGRMFELNERRRISLEKMVYTVERYEDYIIRKAQEYNVPKHLALGLAVLENGGGTDKGTFCCKGIMQLSKPVARHYGLKIVEKLVGKGRKKRRVTVVDERLNPEKNIDSGIHYLADLYNDYFRDWGFTAQAYHAGPGRVKQGIQRYLASKGRHVKLRQITPELIQQEDAKWITIMQNPAAYRFFQGLQDETEYYLPKALACWRIYLHRKEIFGR